MTAELQARIDKAVKDYTPDVWNYTYNIRTGQTYKRLSKYGYKLKKIKDSVSN